MGHVRHHGTVLRHAQSLEIGGERGYRVVTYAVQSKDRELVGYYRSLMGAVRGAHRHFIAQHAGGRDSREYGRVQ